jgi:hypothetical protein
VSSRYHDRAPSAVAKADLAEALRPSST